MRQDPYEAEPTFKERLRACLYTETASLAPTGFARHVNIYNAGDRADHVYFICEGRVKQVTLSVLGKECLLAIHMPGDVFGEVCLGSSVSDRPDTATTMEETVVKALSAARFLESLRREQLYEGFIRYLVDRIAIQQRIVTSLVTVDSEHRLGETLLLLASTLGAPDARSRRIRPRISHEELSQMVGTTRPRVTTFMNRFRALGLIEISPERHVIVKEAKLAAHLNNLK
jgi:CRP/FNR family cyclic AMP-dependent transcriptional regulator